MFENAVVYASGLHPPWNNGESVVPKQMLECLARIYDRVEVVSLIDQRRFDPENTRLYAESFHNCVFSYATSLKSPPKKLESPHESHYHVFSPLNIKSALSRTGMLRHFLSSPRRWFFYNYLLFNFSYGALDRVGNLLNLLFAGSLSSQFTTSMTVSRMLRVLGGTFYLPAPVDNSFLQGEPRAPDTYDPLNLRMLYVGNLNGFRFPCVEVFSAVKALVASGRKVHLSVYAPEFEPNCRDGRIVERIAARLGLTDHVTIKVTNLTLPERVETYLANDILVQPSRTLAAIDPPITILEAMASGCIVLTTDVGNSRELISGMRGLLVGKVNLCRDIIDVLTCLSKSRAEQIVRNARNYVCQIHTAEHCARLIREIVTSRTGSPLT